MSVKRSWNRSKFELLEHRSLLAGDTLCAPVDHEAAEIGKSDAEMPTGNDVEIELETRLTGAGPEKGEAEWKIESDDDRLEIEFELEVEDAQPGSVHEVMVAGVVVGQIRIDGEGRGELRLGNDDDSDKMPLPDNFPTNPSGAEVRVGTILSGTFAENASDVSDGDDDEQECEQEKRFAAALTGAGSEHGEAELERENDDDRDEIELEVEVEDAVPGSVHQVAVDGVVVAELTVGDDGHGRVRLSTNMEELGDLPIPDNFPASAGAGSVVTVGSIVSGTLAEAQQDGDNGEQDGEGTAEPEQHFSAALTGAGSEHGEAELERENDDDRDEIELEVEVEDAVPGSVHQVAVDGVVVAELTVGDDGHGRVRLSTNMEEPGDLPIPDNFPASAGTGSVVTVGSIVSGMLGLHGDLDDNHRVNADDVDLLFAAIRAGSTESRMDLDRNRSVNSGDATYLVENLIGTVFGDADLDGIFDSADLVKVFQAGQYERNDAGSANWQSGDWSGDGRFDSSDLVLAFQSGGYSA